MWEPNVGDTVVVVANTNGGHRPYAPDQYLEIGDEVVVARNERYDDKDCIFYNLYHPDNSIRRTNYIVNSEVVPKNGYVPKIGDDVTIVARKPSRSIYWVPTDDTVMLASKGLVIAETDFHGHIKGSHFSLQTEGGLEGNCLGHVVVTAVGGKRDSGIPADFPGNINNYNIVVLSKPHSGDVFMVEMFNCYPKSASSGNCSCDITTLLRAGCNCGAVPRYQDTFGT
jgi:hypothetical protein